MLVGRREWEVVAPSKKQKVDLLYIYSEYQYDQLRKEKKITQHIWKEVDEEMKIEEDAGIEFTTQEDMIEDSNIIINMGNKDNDNSKHTTKNKKITEAEEINWDDI